jgi:O-methyltransferase
MKTLLINFIRKVKGIALLLKIHFILNPFSGFFMYLAYLAKFSGWVAKNKSGAGFSDFYSYRFNYGKRTHVYKWINEKYLQEIPVSYLEFGVAGGHSFRWWSENQKNQGSRFYGFDTFTGLPEKWNIFKQGSMSADGKLPELSDLRCTFKKGLFQDTLPAFLKDYTFDKRNVIHMDADLYSSTLYVLTSLAPYLRKGDIIIFDEFGVPVHEFRAFLDFTNSFYLKTDLIAASNNFYQAAFIVN